MQILNFYNAIVLFVRRNTKRSTLQHIGDIKAVQRRVQDLTEMGHLGRFVADVLHLRANKISLSILALLFFGTIHASSGDPLHHCIGNKTVYDCSSKRFIKVPLGIPDSVQKLDLGNNLLTALKESTFENLSNVESLSLSHNAIHKIDEKSFHALQELRTLSLKSNRINEIYIATFCPLTKMTKLDLSDNRIQYLPSQLFSANTELMELYIKNNMITKMGNEVFANLYRVHILVMSYNKLQYLVETTFIDMTSLESVDMSYNNFTKLETELFIANGNLKTLDLSHNEDIVIHDESVFLCNKNLQSLYLKDCNLNLKSLHWSGGLLNLKILYYGGNKNCGYLHNSNELDVQCLPGDEEIQWSPGSHSSNGMVNDIAYPVTRNVYSYDSVCPKKQEFPSSGYDNTIVNIVVGVIICACVVLIAMVCYKYKNYFRNMNCRNNPQLARGKAVPESVALNDV